MTGQLIFHFELIPNHKTFTPPPVKDKFCLYYSDSASKQQHTIMNIGVAMFKMKLAQFGEDSFLTNSIFIFKIYQFNDNKASTFLLLFPIFYILILHKDKTSLSRNSWSDLYGKFHRINEFIF